MNPYQSRYQGEWSLPHPNVRRVRKRAFSLIEIVVVLAIIAILVTIGVGIKPRTGNPRDAMFFAKEMISQARLEAAGGSNITDPDIVPIDPTQVTKVLKTRTAICVDSSAGGRYLRSLVNLHGTDGDGDGVFTWTTSGDPRQLPPGTIFWPALSSPAISTNSASVQLPGAASTAGVTFQFIEFNAVGEVSEPGTQWVFVNAIPDDTGSAPVVPNALDRDGFIIRQTGNLALFDEPADIIAP